MNLMSDINNRIQRIRSDFGSYGIDALLVSKPSNVMYLTGRETGYILITENSLILWIKDIYRDLYSEIYSRSNHISELRDYDKGVIAPCINEIGIKKLGVENISVSSYERLRKEIEPELIICDIVEKRRAVKSKYEIGLLKKSAEITMKGMKKAYELIDGVSNNRNLNEIDIAAEIEYEIRGAGSETPPFGEGMLLASGQNSADIHARPRQVSIIKNSLVVVDLGARYSGYYSDMTRTIPAGRLNSSDRDLLEFVRNLEHECIDRLYEGMHVTELYDFAEKKIKGKGFKFYHSLGHGVGLDVHELPNIVRESEDVLTNGMVFTIEPGIYIPKKFGIRFEDMVLLKRGRADILTA